MNLVVVVDIFCIDALNNDFISRLIDSVSASFIIQLGKAVITSRPLRYIYHLLFFPSCCYYLLLIAPFQSAVIKPITALVY